MLLYILSFIFLGTLLLGYFKMADHFNIIDKPNERSSHTRITIRGGGIVFPAAALLWFVLFGFSQSLIIFALLLLSIVSFLDDVLTISSKVRIIVHFVAVTLLFWPLQILALPWYGIVLAYLVVVGWINAFNFMDGINGITAIYSLVALTSFAWLNHSQEFISQPLILLLILSVLIFSFFNVRKRAKTFAGDVGSVSMAFLLAWFIILLMLNTGRPEYILFFAVYGIDSGFTILIRLQQRQNIFEAHRSHLYQYLSNELRWPHVLVSGIYALIQLGINILTIELIAKNLMTWHSVLLILLGLSSVYLIIRKKVTNALQPEMGQTP